MVEALPVLKIENLTVAYETELGWLDTVRDVSLSVGAREKYGLVGESGSGKTTLALAALRYLASNGRVREGRVLLNGEDLLAKPLNEMRRVWGGQVGMVYQNPSTAMNPSLRIGQQIDEVARLHLGLSGEAARRKTLEMLRKVRMPDPEAVARRYPHELSGGMLQRCLIAMALTSDPQLLLMDEPTTALDVTTEAVVLDLIESLAQEMSSAVLYITHNLGVVARLCDRVGVLYAGELVEEGPVRDLFHRPRHPYTQGLLACVPRVYESKQQRQLSTIPGLVPKPNELPHGCVFADRCYLAEPECRAERPRLLEKEEGRRVACRRWEDVAKQSPPAPAPVEGTARDAAPEPLLVAEGIRKYFYPGGWTLPWRKRRPLKAVDGVSLELPRALTVGLVGESGSGKTTLGRCIMGLIEPTSGEVRLHDVTLAPSVADRPLETLKRMQMVFQNPDASLNPRHTVGNIVGRPLVRLAGLGRRDVSGRVRQLLASVHLPAHYVHRLPEELSGGEKQRVAIARAFAADPDLIVADEPVSALDVSVQGALLNLLGDLQAEKGTSYLFVSHDLAAVRHLSDYVAVVYLGLLWEIGTADEVYAPPYHPYTEALLSAIPVVNPDVSQTHIRLEGPVPSPVDPPSGCRFHTRCPRKLGEICEREEPPWRQASHTHRICCHRELDDLRLIQAPAIETDDMSEAGRD